MCSTRPSLSENSLPQERHLQVVAPASLRSSLGSSLMLESGVSRPASPGETRAESEQARVSCNAPV